MPTYQDLTVASAKLAKENAALQAEVDALRALLRTIGVVGKLPSPDRHQWAEYQQANQTRLLEIRRAAHDAAVSNTGYVERVTRQLARQFPELGYTPVDEAEEAAAATDAAVLAAETAETEGNGPLNLAAAADFIGRTAAEIEAAEVVKRNAEFDAAAEANDDSLTAALNYQREHRGIAVTPWVKASDESRWTAFLADGRLAHIERLDDGASFLPRISAFGKAEEEATGPVCDGLLNAAAWVDRFAREGASE